METEVKWVNVRFSPELKNALDNILKFDILQAPLLPRKQSDVIRELVAKRSAEIEKLRCPQCDQFTIPDEHRPGARWCGNCAEPVLFFPPNNGQ